MRKETLRLFLDQLVSSTRAEIIIIIVGRMNFWFYRQP